MKRLLPFMLLFAFLASALPADGSDKSVYELDPLKDGLIGGAGLLLFGTSLLLDNIVDQRPASEVILNPADINGFDRWAATGYDKTIDSVSDVIVAGLMGMPALLFLRKDFDDILVIGLMYSEAMLISMGLKDTVKASVSRYRPYGYFENPPEDYNKPKSADSFFSGHTTFAFTSAAFLTQVFSDYNPDSPWRFVVGAASYSAASAVAILRVASGNHFPSDVIVGAAAGTLVGILVPLFHKVDGGDGVELALYGDGNSSLCFTVRRSF